MTGAKEWALEIDKAWLETQDDMRDAVVTLGLQGVTLLDFKSPVGDPDIWKANAGKVRNGPGWHGRGYVGGTFRGSWILTIGAPSTAVPDVPDADGTDTVARNFAAMTAYPEKAWPPVYIVNNQPYAEALENGHSSQVPPGGMVALTYVELAARWEKTTI